MSFYILLGENFFRLRSVRERIDDCKFYVLVEIITLVSMSERHFDVVPIASMANTFIYENPLLNMTLFNVKLNHKNGNITFAVTVFLGKLSNDDLLYTTTQKHVFFNDKVQYITKILLNTLKALIIVIKKL